MTLVSYTSKIGATLGPEAPLPSPFFVELLPSPELSYPANREDKRESDGFRNGEDWLWSVNEEEFAVSGLAQPGLLTEGDPRCCDCEMHVTPEVGFLFLAQLCRS